MGLRREIAALKSTIEKIVIAALELLTDGLGLRFHLSELSCSVSLMPVSGFCSSNSAFIVPFIKIKSARYCGTTPARPTLMRAVCSVPSGILSARTMAM
jgi:hypothetical protein